MPETKTALPFPTPDPAAAPPARPRKAAPRTQARPPVDLDRLARRLEADWQVALRSHEAAVHRQFHDLRAALRTRKPAKLAGKDAVKLRAALAPKLKPKRGRAKDLRRVEDALGGALARLD